MPKQTIPKPTDGELAILRVLWDEGPCTVRQVLDKLNESRPTGYTTVLKLLQIMTEKRLVVRDESRRTHIYRARYSEDHTQHGIVLDLLERAFGGSAQKLVVQALSSAKVSPDELARIRELLDQIEKEQS